MNENLCPCGLPVATCPHLGAFDSSEYGATREERLRAKARWFLDARDVFGNLERLLPAIEAKRVLLLADMATGGTRFIPQEVKDAMQYVALASALAEHLPDEDRLNVVRIIAKVAAAIASFLGA